MGRDVPDSLLHGMVFQTFRSGFGRPDKQELLYSDNSISDSAVRVHNSEFGDEVKKLSKNWLLLPISLFIIALIFDFAPELGLPYEKISLPLSFPFNNPAWLIEIVAIAMLTIILYKAYRKPIIVFVYIFIFTFIFLLELSIQSIIQTPENYIVNLTNPTQILYYNETQSNSSQSSWNETFTTNENMTFYITIPKNSDVIFGALNLSGVFNDVYDDTEDSYINSSSSTWTSNLQPSQCVDEDWTNWCEPDGQIAWIVENYTSTNNIDNITWNGKFTSNSDPSSGYNCYVNISFWNYTEGDWTDVFNNLTDSSGSQVIYNHTFTVSASDFTGSNKNLSINTTLTDTANCYISYYEGEIILGAYPNSPYLDVGSNGNKDWEYSGEFNHTQNRTSDFSSEINTYLSTCSEDSNGLCTVPFILHSDSAGQIQIDDINITWSQENTNMSQLFLYEDKSSKYQIYWNDSFKIGSNITIDGFYVNNASTVGYWDDVSYDLSYKSGNAYIDITDLILTYPNTSAESNHTLTDDVKWSTNLTIRKSDGSYSDSYVIESNDQVTRTYYANNTGTADLSGCNATLENRTVGTSLNSYVSFNTSNFALTAGTTKYFTMTLTNVPASVTIYYQQLNVTCSGSTVEALMSIDVSSSAATGAGGGGGGDFIGAECGNGICELPHETFENCPADCYYVNISIRPTGFSLFAKPGEIKYRTVFNAPLRISVTNLGVNKIDTKFYVEGELTGKIVFKNYEKAFTIIPDETKIIDFEIHSPSEEGIYQSSFIFETGVEKRSIGLKLSVSERPSWFQMPISFLTYEFPIPLPTRIIKVPVWTILLLILVIIVIIFIIL